jgi:hypothetical protein
MAIPGAPPYVDGYVDELRARAAALEIEATAAMLPTTEVRALLVRIGEVRS